MRSLLALLHTVSLRYLGKRWDRAAHIASSIALGVAMLVSTHLLNQCLVQAAAESVTPGAGNADLMVTSNRRVPMELADTLRQVPGVADAQPLIIERVLLDQKHENRTIWLVGLELKSDGAAAANNPFDAKVTYTNFDFPMGHPNVLLGKELADALSSGGAVPKTLRIRAGGRDQTVEVRGYVTLGGKAAKLGGSIMGMRITDAAKMLDQV